MSVSYTPTSFAVDRHNGVVPLSTARAVRNSLTAAGFVVDGAPVTVDPVALAAVPSWVASGDAGSNVSDPSAVALGIQWRSFLSDAGLDYDGAKAVLDKVKAYQSGRSAFGRPAPTGAETAASIAKAAKFLLKVTFVGVDKPRQSAGFAGGGFGGGFGGGQSFNGGRPVDVRPVNPAAVESAVADLGILTAAGYAPAEVLAVLRGGGLSAADALAALRRRAGGPAAAAAEPTPSPEPTAE